MELEVSSAEQAVQSVVESVETVEVVAASEDGVMDPSATNHHGLGMEHQIMVRPGGGDSLASYVCSRKEA